MFDLRFGRFTYDLMQSFFIAENHYYSDSDYYQTKFYEEPVNYDHYEPYAQVQKTPVENVVDQFHNLVDRQSNGLRRQGIGLIIAPVRPS